MISALDSSVILDVLTGSPRFADASEQLLRRASSAGRLILGECVAAEILPAFNSKEDFPRFLLDWQVDFVPSSLESSALAGEYFARFLQRGGKARRLLPRLELQPRGRWPAAGTLPRQLQPEGGLVRAAAAPGAREGLCCREKQSGD
jgi:hypothetical protein